MLCERCYKIVTNKKLEKILADREAAIKRMNERSNNAIKKERKERT